MDAYRDEGMGDVIFGEPFLRDIRLNAKRFQGMITIHNGNEEVTYQMVRYHLRFKHHTNEQRNKIPPLLKYVKYGMIGKLTITERGAGGNSGRFNLRRISLTGFPARSVGSSNADALDSPYLLVLIIGTSQSRQHDKSESDKSRKSPTAELFDVDSGRISIHHLRFLIDLDGSRLYKCTFVICKRRAFWSLNEDILKITVSEDQYVVSIKEDVAYPCLHSPKTTKGMKINTPMDDPNLTMEEYIRFKEEKAHKRGKVFNWQTATYGKIRVDDDLHNLSSVEAEFPAIVINDAVAPQDELQCKSQVSTPVNDEIDFRISFDESDDEDYTILFDKNSCFDDLDFFTDFKNEFPAIVYNDAQTEPILNPQHIDEFDLNDKTSLSEYDEEEQNVLYFNDLFPFNIIRPDNLKSEKDNDDSKIDIILSFEDNEYTHGSTTVFETSHDKNTKNFRPGNFVINLNLRIVIWIHYANGMLFFLIKNLCAPFGVPFDPKRYYKDGVCAILLRRPRPIRQCLNFYTLVLSSIDFANMALPLCEQRHRFLRYEGMEYLDTDIFDFEGRLANIHRREVHRVPVFDFGGLPDLMAEGLSGRMLMEHRDEAGVSVFTSRAWRRMLDIRGPLVHELILEFFSTFRFGQAILDLDTPGTLQFQLGGARRRMSWRQFILALGLHTGEEMQMAGFGISSAGDFLGTTPSYTTIREPILRLCHRLIACSIAGRSHTPEKVTVTDLFYLRGMEVSSINVPYMLVRYLRLFTAVRKSRAHISEGQFVARLADHFGLSTAEILGGLTVIAPELLVSMEPERQPDAAAGAPTDAEDAPIVNEGDQAVPAPVQAPQQPPLPPPPAAARTIPQRLGRLEEDVQGPRRDVGSLRGLVERSMTDQGRFSTWMMSSFQRRTRQRTGEANTSAAQQDPQQPDP
ncbi:hypothetical protein Tco_1377574 [Tanacetum coccineum]